jgi:hypothetical protein
LQFKYYYFIMKYVIFPATSYISCNIPQHRQDNRQVKEKALLVGFMGLFRSSAVAGGSAPSPQHPATGVAA